MVEQNSDQKFSYDRAQLIEMLDAALAKQAGNGDVAQAKSVTGDTIQ
jgi:hypothetical protein